MIRHYFLLFIILLSQPIYSKINTWALQWKMSFNPDPTKQAQETIFSRKNLQRNHPGLMFNNSIVNVTTIHKHLCMIFDSKLSFDEHLTSVLTKISKTVGLLQKFKLQIICQTLSLLW